MIPELSRQNEVAGVVCVVLRKLFKVSGRHISGLQNSSLLIHNSSFLIHNSSFLILKIIIFTDRRRPKPVVDQHVDLTRCCDRGREPRQDRGFLHVIQLHR